MFDLSDVSAPIVGATLVLFNAVGGYESAAPSETYALGGSMAPMMVERLEALGDYAAPPDVDAAAIALAAGLYADLATTPAFGAAVLTPASDGTLVSMALSPGGVGYLNLFLGSMAVLGGMVPTAAPPDGVPQSVFGFGAPFFSGEPLPMLLLTTADAPPLPAPASGLLALTALAAAGKLRRRVRPAS